MKIRLKTPFNRFFPRIAPGLGSGPGLEPEPGLMMEPDLGALWAEPGLTGAKIRPGLAIRGLLGLLLLALAALPAGAALAAAPRQNQSQAQAQNAQSSPLAGGQSAFRVDNRGGGRVDELAAGQVLGQLLGQGQLPGQIPGQIPGQLPGQALGQTLGQALAQTLGQAPGQATGQVTGQATGQTGAAQAGAFKAPWRTVGEEAEQDQSARLLLDPAARRGEEKRLLPALFNKPFECRREEDGLPALPTAGEADYWRGVFASTQMDSEYYLRQSAGLGHWKAELALINLRVRDLKNGFPLADGAEEGIFKPLQALMRRNIPEAHVIMAEITEQGLAGVKPDLQRALSLYRKAAELGSVEAQVYLGNAFLRQNESALMPVAESLFNCAMRQQSGSGAYGLGRVLVAMGRIPEALPVFLRAAEWGNARALAVLAGFVGPQASFFERDQELSDCYGALAQAAALDRNDSPARRRITFPDLEKRCPGAFVIPALRRVKASSASGTNE